MKLAEVYTNFLIASSPGGIEHQEKQGQQQQAQLETLPIDGTSRERKTFESLGFVFDDRPTGKALFVSVKFPTGWKKVPTDHSMWTDLVDGKGRKRGSIFYKAAFYDTSAHVHLTPFISICTYHKDAKEERRVTIQMGDESRLIGTHHKDDYKAQDKLVDEAKEWLANNFPDWENPVSYWPE